MARARAFCTCACSAILYFFVSFFFFNDTATTEIYTLSLHDALPIWASTPTPCAASLPGSSPGSCTRSEEHTSELQSRGLISYAVFCLKKTKHNDHPVGSVHVQPGDGAARGARVS